MRIYAFTHVNQKGKTAMTKTILYYCCSDVRLIDQSVSMVQSKNRIHTYYDVTHYDVRRQRHRINLGHSTWQEI